LELARAPRDRRLARFHASRRGFTRLTEGVWGNLLQFTAQRIGLGRPADLEEVTK